MFSNLKVELCMLNILCMFRYTGVLFYILKRRECEAHLALTIITILSTVERLLWLQTETWVQISFFPPFHKAFI